MQVDVGEVDQILQLRAFTQHHHQLTEAVQLPKIQGDTCSDTRPLTFSIDCQHRAFTSTCVCVCVRAYMLPSGFCVRASYASLLCPRSR